MFLNYFIPHKKFLKNNNIIMNQLIPVIFQPTLYSFAVVHLKDIVFTDKSNKIVDQMIGCLLIWHRLILKNKIVFAIPNFTNFYE